jgi:hypothetical protein
MRLPQPRGFPATSNTLAVCDHVADARSRQLSDTAPPDVDLARLFSKSPPLPRKQYRTLQPGEPRATVSLGITERKLFISTGKRRVKKDGSQGAEEKIPVLLVTVTATVSDGKRDFYFQITNRSTLVFDSRDRQRKPLETVRSELLRMCPEETASTACDALAGYMRSIT